MLDHPLVIGVYRAFSKLVDEWIESGPLFGTDAHTRRLLILDMERSLDAVAKAIDACKSGSEISMQHLQIEMRKAWWLSYKRLQMDAEPMRAVEVFDEAMKPHLQARLF